MISTPLYSPLHVTAQQTSHTALVLIPMAISAVIPPILVIPADIVSYHPTVYHFIRSAAFVYQLIHAKQYATLYQ
jgi:hypothetical protein